MGRPLKLPQTKDSCLCALLILGTGQDRCRFCGSEREAPTALSYRFFLFGVFCCLLWFCRQNFSEPLICKFPELGQYRLFEAAGYAVTSEFFCSSGGKNFPMFKRGTKRPWMGALIFRLLLGGLGFQSATPPVPKSSLKTLQLD